MVDANLCIVGPSKFRSYVDVCFNLDFVNLKSFQHEVSILASLYTIVHYGAQLMETGTLSYGNFFAIG